MKLISFSGPSASGKSTLLTRCESLYGDRYSYVKEITRSIKRKGLPINEAGSDITQLLIMNSHIENSLLSNAILDRCALDGLVYTQYLYNHGTVSYETLKYASYVYSLLIKKYDVIFYTSPVDLEDDGVRSTSKSFRDETIEIFEKVIKNDVILKPKLVYLSGSVEDRMATIQGVILSLR